MIAKLLINGGEGGIRTHGTRKGITVFEIDVSRLTLCCPISFCPNSLRFTKTACGSSAVSYCSVLGGSLANWLASFLPSSTVEGVGVF